MANGVNIPKKRSFLAIHEMERLKIRPIEMILTVYTRALAAYDEARGLSDKSDAGAAYLAVAGQMATKLAAFQYPSLSAMAVGEMSKESKDVKPMTTAEAVRIINSDPFLKKQLITDLPTIESDPILPIGVTKDV